MVGLPAGAAVHVIAAASPSPGAKSVTVLDPLMLEALTETDTAPLSTLETAKRRVIPLPDNAPRVAEPPAGVIAKSPADKEPGSRLKKI